MKRFLLFMLMLTGLSAAAQTDKLPNSARSTPIAGYLVNPSDTTNRQFWLNYGSRFSDRMVRYPELLRTLVVDQAYARHYADSLYLVQLQQAGLNKDQANQRLDSIKAVTFRLSGGNPVITGNQILQSGYWQINKEGVYMGDATTNGKSYIGPNAVVFFNPDNSTAWQWFGPQNAFRFFNPSTQNFINLFTNWDGTNNVNVMWPLVSGRLLTDGAASANYGSKAQQDANAQQIAKNSSQIATNKLQITIDSLRLNKKADTTLTTFVLSSKLGGTGDADLSLNSTYTGALDYTAQIQALLNYGQGTRRVKIIVDGKYGTKGLKYYGPVDIELRPGCGLILKDSSNTALLSNGNFTYNGTRTDDQLYLHGGGILHFNGQKQKHDTPGEGWVAGIRIGGVHSFRIENVTLLKPKTFTVWAMNFDLGSFDNFIIDVGDNAAINADGIHLNGPFTTAYISDGYIRSYDDGIAANADDQLPNNTFNPNGDIGAVYVNRIHFTGSLFGFRGLSAYHRIGLIDINGISGDTKGYSIINDNFWQNYISTSQTKVATVTDGPGNFGTIIVRDNTVNVTEKGVTFQIKQAQMVFAGQIDNLQIYAPNRRRFAYNGSMVNVDQAYTTIKRMYVDGLTSIDTAGTNTNPSILLSNGTIGNLTVANAHSESPADVDRPLVQIAGASVARTTFIAPYTKGILSPLKVTAGSAGIVQGVNVTHLNNTLTAGFINTSVTIPYADIRGYRGGNIKSGTGTVSTFRTDTAFASKNGVAYSVDGNLSFGSTSATVAGGLINYHLVNALGSNAGIFQVLQANGSPVGFGGGLQLNGDATHSIYLYQFNGTAVGKLQNSYGIKAANVTSGATPYRLVFSNGLAGNNISNIPDYLTQFPGGNMVLQQSADIATNNGYLWDVRGTGYYDGLLTLNAGLQSAGSISQTGGSNFRQYFSTTANEYFTIAPNTSTGAFDIGTYQGTSGSNRAMNITSASSIMFDARNYNSMIWKFGGVNFMQLTSSTLYPNTTNTLDFGGTGNRWKSGWFTTASAGHIVGISGAPTIAAGTGAGTSPTISVSGTDISGTITLTTGSSPAAGVMIATITFNGAYLAAPHPAGNPAAKNAITASLTGNSTPYYTTTTTTLVLNSNSTGLAANTTYVWDYTLTQ